MNRSNELLSEEEDEAEESRKFFMFITQGILLTAISVFGIVGNSLTVYVLVKVGHSNPGEDGFLINFSSSSSGGDEILWMSALAREEQLVTRISHEEEEEEQEGNGLIHPWLLSPASLFDRSKTYDPHRR